jgi:FkbM family methyltransferase
LTKIDAAKLARISSQLSREEYWGLVQQSIFSASELSSIVASSDSTVEISKLGVVLNYPITRTVNIKLIVDGSDMRSIGVSVIADGRYEPLLQEALLAVSKDCSLFADIGANAGFYSIAVRSTNPDCEVISFECNPRVREVFLENIKLNGLDKISIRKEALSDKTGEASLHVPAFTGSGGGSLQNLHPEEGEPQKFAVSLMPLDSLKLQGIDLMKIDVEGAELSVVMGGITSITSSHPTIFIELLRKWMKPFNSSPTDVAKLLTELGYLIFEVADDQLRELDKISEETLATNFVFVHESRPGHLSILRGFSEFK